MNLHVNSTKMTKVDKIYRFFLLHYTYLLFSTHRNARSCKSDSFRDSQKEDVI
ncbi:hypothetical protein CHCC20335_2901 [Bacillus paralicheniformis]|nr:hypothetical protein CHCC20335_2901 [Bacillus paralicheniformis]